MTLASLALALVTASTTPSVLVPPDLDGGLICVPLTELEQRTEQMKAAVPNMRVERWDGEDAQIFLDYVSQASSTRIVGDAVILARSVEGEGSIAVVRGDQGCMANFTLPAALLMRAIAAIGVRA